jgi:hypothetical protein
LGRKELRGRWGRRVRLALLALAVLPGLSVLLGPSGLPGQWGRLAQLVPPVRLGQRVHPELLALPGQPARSERRQR